MKNMDHIIIQTIRTTILRKLKVGGPLIATITLTYIHYVQDLHASPLLNMQKMMRRRPW